MRWTWVAVQRKIPVTRTVWRKATVPQETSSALAKSCLQLLLSPCTPRYLPSCALPSSWLLSFFCSCCCWGISKCYTSWSSCWPCEAGLTSKLLCVTLGGGNWSALAVQMWVGCTCLNFDPVTAEVLQWPYLVFDGPPLFNYIYLVHRRRKAGHVVCPNSQGSTSGGT